MTANQDTPPESTPPNPAIRKHKKDKAEIRYIPVQSIYKDLESVQLNLPFSAAANFSIANIPLKEWQENAGARMGICLVLPWLTDAQQRITAKLAEVSADFLPYISVKRLAARMFMHPKTLYWHIKEICNRGILRRTKILMWKVVNDQRVGQPVWIKCWQFNIKAILITYIALQEAERTGEGEKAKDNILQYSFEDFINQGKESESESTKQLPTQYQDGGKIPGFPEFSESSDAEKIPGIPEFSESSDAEKFRDSRKKNSGIPGISKARNLKGNLQVGGGGENEKNSDPSPPPSRDAAAEKNSAPKIAKCAACGHLFNTASDPEFCPVHEKKGK